MSKQSSEIVIKIRGYAHHELSRLTNEKFFQQIKIHEQNQRIEQQRGEKEYRSCQ